MPANEALVPGRKKARIEIIPLIDVVFFLLATFVLFTLSLDKIGSLTATLPKTGGDPPAQDTTVFIQTSEPGVLYWKQGETGVPEMISMAQLPSRLSEYQQRVHRPRVFVRGDQKAKFGAAVDVFEAVRRVGIKEVSIETKPSRTGS